MIPSFLIAKAYRRGSLCNHGSGFEFRLRNAIGNGTIVGAGPLVVDGASYPPSSLTLSTPGGEARADELSHRNPLEFEANTEMRVFVEGNPLAEGAHHIVFPAMVGEAGRITLDVSDELSQE